MTQLNMTTMFNTSSTTTAAPEWIFPFSTCERTYEAPFKQPYSQAINFVTLLSLAYQISKAKTLASRNVIAGFIFFEVLHFLSHSVHLSNRDYHEIPLHLSGYLINFCFYQLFRAETGHFLTKTSNTLILSFWVLDVILFFTVRDVLVLWCGLTQFILIALPYYSHLPYTKQSMLLNVIRTGTALTIMFVVEKYYCGYFQSINFDYHAWVIEISVLLFVNYTALYALAPSEKKPMPVSCLANGKKHS